MIQITRITPKRLCATVTEVSLCFSVPTRPSFREPHSPPPFPQSPFRFRHRPTAHNDRSRRVTLSVYAVTPPTVSEPLISRLVWKMQNSPTMAGFTAPNVLLAVHITTAAVLLWIGSSRKEKWGMNSQWPGLCWTLTTVYYNFGLACALPRRNQTTVFQRTFLEFREH